DDLLEGLTVLRGVDGGDRRADELDVVLGQHPGLVQRDRRVEGRLPAEGGQQRVGALLGDDRRDDLGGDRLDVGGVGDLRVGHDRRRVGVDEDDAQALLAQHPAGLGAGVVELGGLPDDDRPGADDENGTQVGTTRHQASSPVVWERACRRAATSSRKRSNRWAASCGPAAASGWYWTENAGMSRARRPSTTPSLRLMWDTSTRPKRPSS